MYTSQTMSSGRQKTFELFAVALTGAGKFIFVDLWYYKGWYVSIACVLWISYIVWQWRRDGKRLKLLGFTRMGFRESFLRLFPFAAGCIILFVIMGLFRNSITLNWHVIPILLLYPIWGVIQQFLMMALFAGNLHDVKGHTWPKMAIMVATAFVFSIVHFPSNMLVGGTFILAFVYSNHYLYRGYKNLWVLGLYHGWLAGLFYYLVLGRDPWEEMMRVF
jgi:hypothetical protein